MASNKKYIITGAPGTGKTTIIDALNDRGVYCNGEISRSIIQEELDKGGDALPWKNLTAFSERVIVLRAQQHSTAPEDQPSFYDRGIIDVLAYMDKDKLSIPESWFEMAKKHPYNKKVFIAPPWEKIFTNDEERKETFEVAKEIHEFLCKTYRDYGYELIEIPKASVEERIEFLLKSI